MFVEGANEGMSAASGGVCFFEGDARIETILWDTGHVPVRTESRRVQRQETTVEQDAKDLGGASRSQNVVYVVPHDWASISFFLAPLIERVEEAVPHVQLLVLTADAESAAAVAGAAVKLATTKKIGIMKDSSVNRREPNVSSTTSKGSMTPIA